MSSANIMVQRSTLGFNTTVHTFTTATGGSTETVPAGAHTLKIEMWSGGGGGGVNSSSVNGGGGGSGGYCTLTLNAASGLAGGQTFSYFITQDGAGATTAGATGNNGGVAQISSSFSYTGFPGGFTMNAGGSTAATGGTSTTGGTGATTSVTAGITAVNGSTGSNSPTATGAAASSGGVGGVAPGGTGGTPGGGGAGGTTVTHGGNGGLTMCKFTYS